MTQQHRIVCVIGTRPEAIKMAPVVTALHASDWAKCVVVVTAQHRDLLDQMLDRLEVPVDHDLNLMTVGQSPSELISRMLPALDRVLEGERPDVVLAQGDTTTVFVAALASFHRKIAFGHVEAGLRTRDLAQPFPEEGYRQMVARIARWHFAPTQTAAAHLHAESVLKENIHVTGNTGIDTLLHTVGKLGPAQAQGRRMLLLTAHRRENFGQALRNILTAVLELTERYADIEVIYPVHPNPNVQECARALLANHARIHLLPPQDYFEFVDLMRRAHLILTDSGGVQEEAPALAKPVLVLREQTERPEAIDMGVARLVGTRQSDIFSAACKLLDDPGEYAAMARGASPYGDGRAAARIVELLRPEAPALHSAAAS
ncbi:MAG: non-hydrolyzing UDP-N-acetylglucosamine 2-epimerase [Rudaea sp.]